jgi:hypothetical protein
LVEVFCSVSSAREGTRVRGLGVGCRKTLFAVLGRRRSGCRGNARPEVPPTFPAGQVLVHGLLLKGIRLDSFGGQKSRAGVRRRCARGGAWARAESASRGAHGRESAVNLARATRMRNARVDLSCAGGAHEARTPPKTPDLGATNAVLVVLVGVRHLGDVQRRRRRTRAPLRAAGTAAPASGGLQREAWRGRLCPQCVCWPGCALLVGPQAPVKNIRCAC